MKTITIWISSILIVIFISCLAVNAQITNINDAQFLASAFLNYKNSNTSIGRIQSISDERNLSAFLVSLEPKGFLVLPADQRLCPILAYSFIGDDKYQSTEWRTFLSLIKNDINARTHLAEKNNWPINTERLELLNGKKQDKLFEQWPPVGSTSTEGWLETNWTQSAPYNQMCPMDLNTNQRSLAGCPAVAMSMIVNYNQNIYGLQLDDGDKYYHNFGTGNQYMIDDAHVERDFPSFPELNMHLDQIESKFQSGAALSNDLIAALNFACGVAAHQVFSSSVSGTFGIEQAHEAWLRFGYDTCKLVYPSDFTLIGRLIKNMKAAYPAHLGLVDGPPITVGHNVVVDGYNTDNFFHFNFGWGGSANAWYNMPPQSIPYNLTTIEGIILDIAGWNQNVQITELDIPVLKIYPIPAYNQVFIPIYNQMGFKELNIYSLDGMLLINMNLDFSSLNSIDISTLSSGCYFINIEGFKTTKLIKI